MKKEIMNLIGQAEGTYKINRFSEIRRWTKDAIGEDVDMLEIVFYRINDVEFSNRTVIKSRDYDGIISEIESATRTFFGQVADTLVKDLHAGYIR